MTEGFKLQEKDYNMKQQLFLLSRILMLRLKASQLEDALRKLWPHLLNELVNVFDSYKASKESNEENI
jgi:Mor family transcriptional regulator